MQVFTWEFCEIILSNVLQNTSVQEMYRKLWTSSHLIKKFLTLSWRRFNHIEISPLICRANQWTGFYMIEISVMKELTASFFAQCCENSFFSCLQNFCVLETVLPGFFGVITANILKPHFHNKTFPLNLMNHLKSVWRSIDLSIWLFISLFYLFLTRVPAYVYDTILISTKKDDPFASRQDFLRQIL